MAVERAARPAFFAVVPAFLAVVRADFAVLLAEPVAALRVRVAAAFCAALLRADAERPLVDRLREELEPDDERLLELPEDDVLRLREEDDPLLAERDRLVEERRRRVVGLRRSEAGTSSLTTSPTSDLIWRSRNFCIRSSSRRKRLASATVSRSLSLVATCSMTL